MSTVERILDLARAQGVMITVAESCTSGLLGAALTELPGSSAIFERGFLTYSNAAKMEMLGVREATLDAYGAVSEETAAEMARGALERSQAQIALSITGIAGPGGSDYKPEGRVCFGLARADDTQTQTIDFGPLGRSNVRAASVEQALSLLLTALSE